MKFTLSWLKEHLETSASLEEITNTLTSIGLAVEDVTDPSEKLKPFRIAKVVKTEKHPNADRLKVLSVDPGDGKPIQVICGAPNARTGLIGVLALPGDYIPGSDTKLSKGKIRDVESNGMLCSERELEISEEHEGIIELPDDAPVGESYVVYAGLDDPIIDVELTPNRPDCTGVHGIARDLAAANLGTLKENAPKPVKGGFPCPITVSLEFGESKPLCPAFAVRLIKGVRNGSSPQWLQKKLISIGLRPINVLVDITNFITFDRGRPLHVFDASKVKGDLVVRRGKKNEQFLALDEKEYTVDEDVCVIADDNGVESLSGIMGGEHSGCNEETVDVIVESALWEPLNISQTGRKLGIVSDARYRFERGVDPNFMVPGLEMATELIVELCGGNPSEIAVFGDPATDTKELEFPLSETSRLTGLKILPTEAKKILSKLGFKVTGSTEEIKISVPSWRPDIQGKADLVEEIMRITGVDKIPTTPLPRIENVSKKVLTANQIRRNKVRRSIAELGFCEAVTWSFISHELADMFGGGKHELSLSNPISTELTDMRPSLIPGLLMAAQRNADRGFSNVALFEVGQIFESDKPDGQSMVATGLRRGSAKLTGVDRHWRKKVIQKDEYQHNYENGAEIDAFDVKTDVLSIIESIGVQIANVEVRQDTPFWFNPSRSGTLKLGPKITLAYFGELHPIILRKLDIKSNVAVFEIFLENIPFARKKVTQNKGKLILSNLMSVKRDFAFIIEQSVKASKLVAAAKNADKKLIREVTVFDVYQGSGIVDGKKSIAIEVIIQPTEKTLTDEEIEKISSNIIAEVEKATGGQLRK